MTRIISLTPGPCSSEAFTLLSWNIDGLDKRDTIRRAQAVCKLISSRRPHAVFLQEVVPSTEMEILKSLGADYDYYSAPGAGERYGYYVAILVLKTKGLLFRDNMMCIDLPETVMGRHVLFCTVVFGGVEINLLTSHLESMKDYGGPRKAQLSKVFEIISENPTWIFGGDLNIRDHEVKSVGLPADTVDVWEACGSIEDEKFTWDVSKNDNLQWTYPNKPKCRFDRVYLHSKDGGVRAKGFGLVGKERLEDCGRFPSDHWGLWMELSVDRS